jgi:ATP-dependent HslUV protease ATP-binding subunit HslU
MAKSAPVGVAPEKAKAGRDLTPREVVEELSKYIIGQDQAKKMVAVALRNRYRRQQLSADMRDEVLPKNILMIGPTGVGKTEIARRLSRLVNAPFLKVEATKYTEVGYVGRDVDSMIRDITDQAVRIVQREKMERVQDRARQQAVAQIVNALSSRRRQRQGPDIIEAIGGFLGQQAPSEAVEENAEQEAMSERERVRLMVESGELDNRNIEIEIEEQKSPFIQVFSPAGLEEMGMNLQDMLGGLMPKMKRKRSVTVREAKEILTFQNAQKMVDMDQAVAEAIKRVEESGIIFVDELDKVAGRETGHGPDVSREGVQRDILPIIEGSTVMTKYGPVKTDHILFIGAGAFHVAKPSDLIPELQGRFPLRVELKSLTEQDFVRILKETESSLIKQYSALLAVEGVQLEFSEDAIEEIASIAAQVNSQTQDIGARRLHTIMERVLEDVSFHASEIAPTTLKVTAEYVRDRLADVIKNVDISRYIL